MHKWPSMGSCTGQWWHRVFQGALASLVVSGMLGWVGERPTCKNNTHNTHYSRWLNQLEPSLRKVPFTEEEDRHILQVSEGNDNVHSPHASLHTNTQPCLSDTDVFANGSQVGTNCQNTSGSI